MTQIYDAIVIGAGVAGLAAATQLAEEGARVLVLEGSSLAGGRARSWTDPASGAVVDNGQHLLMGCYEQTLALLDRIGTRSLVQFQERLRVVFEDAAGQGGAIDCPPLPGKLSLLAGLAMYRSLSIGGRIGTARVIRDAALGAPNNRSRAQWPGPSEKDETVDDYLARLGQSPAARRNFWNPLVYAALNEDPEVASSRALRVVIEKGLLAGPDASRLGWSTVGLGELFASPSETYLRNRAGEIRFSSLATRIRATKDEVEVFVRAGETFRAAAGILAIPPRAMLRVLPEDLAGDPELALAGELRTSPIIGVSLWLDRPVLDEPFVGLLGTRMHWAFDRSRMLSGHGANCEPHTVLRAGPHAGPGGAAREESGYCVALVASGAREEAALSTDTLTRLALRELRALFPAARRASLVHALVVKERDATVSPCAGWDALRPGFRTREPRLFLAGDWTATGLPATIESAAASGHIAAAAVLETVGHGATTPLLHQGDSVVRAGS